MIPKKIHYCWFGDAEPDELTKKCIASWSKYCPDYEIVKWSEDNYNVNRHPYMKEAYEAGKWAFVTDYARLDILYEHGGIYFDTDVELIKNPDDLLKNKAFAGMEDGYLVATGLGIGSEPGTEIIGKLRDIYKDIHFKTEFGYDTTACVEYTTNYLKKRGLKKEDNIQTIDDLTIYPKEYFCPVNAGSRKANITENTYTIHHFAASWYQGSKMTKEIKYRLIPLKKVMKRTIDSIFGEGTWKRLKNKAGR